MANLANCIAVSTLLAQPGWPNIGSIQISLGIDIDIDIA